MLVIQTDKQKRKEMEMEMIIIANTNTNNQLYSDHHYSLYRANLRFFAHFHNEFRPDLYAAWKFGG